MEHVERPLLSFGPKASMKASMKLRAFPINACKVFGDCNYSSPESDNIQN